MLLKKTSNRADILLEPKKKILSEFPMKNQDSNFVSIFQRRSEITWQS